MGWKEDGSVILEVVLIVPVLMLLLTGVTTFQQAFNSRNIMILAARHGARAAARFDTNNKMPQEIRDGLEDSPLEAVREYIDASGLSRADFDVNISLSGVTHPTQGREVTLVRASVRQRQANYYLGSNCVSASFIMEDRFSIVQQVGGSVSVGESFDCTQ